MDPFTAVAIATIGSSVIGSIFGGNAASSAAHAQERANQRDLDYKIWADQRNAEQKQYENALTLANMGLQNSNKNAGLVARYGAPGQPYTLPKLNLAQLGALMPEVQTYPGQT